MIKIDNDIISYIKGSSSYAIIIMYTICMRVKTESKIQAINIYLGNFKGLTMRR